MNQQMTAGQLGEEDADGFGDGRIPGVLLSLSELPNSAIISIGGLGKLSNRHEATIRRAIARGELPPPTKLFGASVWTKEWLYKHLDDRLAEAKEELDEVEERIRKHRP